MTQHEMHSLHGRVLPSVDPLPSDLVEGLARHDTAKVADAMAGHGVVHPEIKPLAPEMRFVGSALTVLTRPGDALFVQKAAEVARPGDVVVIDAGGGGDACVIGERLGYFMKRNGAVGIVCDGAIRDSQGMIDLAPPTFARSVCVRIFGSRGPGAINVPVQCGGVPVNPGDVVIGDRDGVVVVPRADAAGVLALADEHLAGELERVKRIESGESMEEVFAVDTKIAAWSA